MEHPTQLLLDGLTRHRIGWGTLHQVVETVAALVGLTIIRGPETLPLPDGGSSTFAIIAESHISLDLHPLEDGWRCFFGVFSCRPMLDTEVVKEYVVGALQLEGVREWRLDRLIPSTSETGGWC